MKLLVQLSLPATDHTDPKLKAVESAQKDWKFASELQEGELFYRTKLNGNLLLTGSDYAWLKARFDEFPCCVEVDVNVFTNTCTGEGLDPFWPGYFLFSAVKWDYTACSATVSEIKPRDAYDALYRVWNKPVDLLAGVPHFLPFVGVYPDRYNWQTNQTTGDSERVLPDGNSVGTGSSTQEHEYKRGLDFQYALGWAIAQTVKDSTASAIHAHKSDFFYSAVNPITGKPNLQKVMMQGSDAKRPASKQPAKKLVLTLKDLLTNLRGLFNVYWMIDPETNYLVLEHYRYFAQRDYVDTGKVTVNLTRFPDALKAANNESVDESNLYGVEELVISNNNASLFNEFKTGSVRYDTLCTPRNDKGEITTSTVTVSSFWTDLMAGYQFAESVPDDSIFIGEVIPAHSSNVYVNLSSNLPILATDYQYHVYQDGIVTVEGLGLCGTLAAANLFINYHRDGRSFTSGLVNSVKQTDGSYSDGTRMGMYSTKRTRKQENIIIPLCCSDMPLNLDGYVKTNLLSKGKLDKGVYDPTAETFTLSVVDNSRCEAAAVVVTPPDPSDDCAPHGTYVDVRTEIAYCSDGVTEMARATIYVYADGQCGTYEVPGGSSGIGGC